MNCHLCIFYAFSHSENSFEKVIQNPVRFGSDRVTNFLASLGLFEIAQAVTWLWF